MASLFYSMDSVISQFLGFERKKLNNKTASIRPTSNKESFNLISELYGKMEINYHNVGSKPKSESEELWSCRYASDIKKHNLSPEKILEKSVAILAEYDYMPGWFNQCPVASGIADPYADLNRAVDLVHWSKSEKLVRLIELKWKSNTPPYALIEVLEYGLAYIFCRVHKRELPLHTTLMNACHVSLEVVVPPLFYDEYFKYHDYLILKDIFERMSKSLNKFAGSKINGLSMSLDALAFPEGFRIPFANGKQVKEKCDTHRLTDEGQEIRDAFHELAPVWPALQGG